MADARRLAGAELAQALRQSRARTLALTMDLSDAQWQVPPLASINPVAWELAHVAWFAEFWVLRGPHRPDERGQPQAARPPRHAGPDALLDSGRLPHAERWSVKLPSRSEVRDMLDAQLADCLAALPDDTLEGNAAPGGHARGDGRQHDHALYFHRLALFHEDMHGEALAWLCASLGYAAPALPPLPRQAARAALRLEGGEVLVGRPNDGPGFAFDNELPQRMLRLDAYEIDATPLSAGAYLRFVEAGGYDDAAFWPGAAGRWRASAARSHPERWRRNAGGWEQRWFERWLPLEPEQPLVHVSAWEAEAYCRWAGRRLPSAAEWEHAATSRPGDFLWGASVWEWTADAFTPYPGFAPGPYRDYSAPWFGNHRELRGGAFATAARLHDPRYRNFFLPGRTDVFVGFRTAAPRA